MHLWGVVTRIPAYTVLSAYSDFDLLIEAINNGAIYKFLTKPWDDFELRKIVRDAFLLTQEITNNETRFEKVIDHDPLTGLQNRFLFRQQTIKAIAECQDKKCSFAIIILDIANFDKINVLISEDRGDEVLKIISNRLKDWVGFENHITRFGSKFYLLVKDVTNSTLNDMLKPLNTKIHEPIKFDNEDIILTTNMGVSLFPEHGNEYDILLANANFAYVQCKHLGANTFKIYDSLNTAIETKLITEAEIYRAITGNQFIIYYQPIVMVDTKKIKCAEALIRWKHPTKGLLAPDSFIPLCEESGLIIPVGTWVLESACKQLKEWNDMGYDLIIAVNISQRQLRDEGFLETLTRIIDSTAITPQNLELEITESIMMHDLGASIEIMHKIEKLSISLSMDDFGTGYSSLIYLKYLPFKRLKIDKTFINDITSKKNSLEILTAIISVAKALGLTLVAEGVETKEQLEILKNQKINLAQGFLFSKPVPIKEFNLLLEKQHL